LGEHDYRQTISSYYGRGDTATRVINAIREAGINLDNVTAADLAPFDNLHARGRAGTIELAEHMGLVPASRVLDIGGGIGGAARTLAAEFGCVVVVFDLTAEFCELGAMLTALTRLNDQVSFRVGNALAAPFPDGSFDAVWMQGVGMNIPDKARLYTEIHRLLAAGGRYGFQEAMSGAASPPHFPVPWARDQAMSFLQSQDDARALLEHARLRVLLWEEVGSAAGAEAQGNPENRAWVLPGVTSDLDVAQAASNMARNLAEDRIRVIQAVCERVG
jgi:ubiquinone/menaquinone biosynthesis C-methylase UbiE